MDVLKQSYTFGRSSLTNKSDKKELKAYLLGSDIVKSRSPKVHNTFFSTAQLSWHYGLRQTTATADLVATLQDPTTIGVSITMPNKVTFMPYLDDLMESARVIGAVNTAFVRLDEQGNRRYIGTNTDCIGIRDSLDAIPSIRKRIRGQPVLIRGSGGAARSAVYALWTFYQPSEIYIINRLKSEVDELIEGMRRSLPGVKLRHIHKREVANTTAAPVVIVGTAPDFPPKSKDEKLVEDICTSFVQRVGKEGVVLDMCYMPNPWTRLCQLGSESGCTIITGTEVVARVCATQYVLWAEREIEPGALEDVLRLMNSEGSPKSKL